MTNDYEKTKDSDIVVITSGIPRKPGMTREELIGVNAGIVKSVTENVLKYSPNAIILCVANPMDTMTYLIHKISGLPKNRIIGMGGALDSARFKYYLSLALEANATEVEGIVIGGHGDTTMIPLKRFAAYRGIPASSLIPAEQLDKVAADTMVGGATLTSLLGTSAWIAPGAAAAQCVAAVLGDQKRLISCSALLEGEYGEKDLCIGVPCILGRDGIEKIVDFNLNDEELALFHKIVKEGLSVRRVEQLAKDMQTKREKAEGTDADGNTEGATFSSHDFDALNHHLTGRFGTPVKLSCDRSGRGKITFSFADEAQLERLIAIFDGLNQ